MYNLEIKSKTKNYIVNFSSDYNIEDLGDFFIIDPIVFNSLKEKPKNYFLVESTEANKSFDFIGNILQQLVNVKLKRSDVLVGIGGGIIQDITAFVASIWMRGISWVFVPTTLLAQCDSCIGSKSSINFKEAKNILGTFNSPDTILIDTNFLSTLQEKEIKSGLGEIIKLFMIDGREFQYSDLLNDMESSIINSLKIKKRFIEEDEFDTGIRNILNYGHCVGHAIESATNFFIPHGIAVSIGMDAANYLAKDIGRIDDRKYNSYKEILKQNYAEYKVRFRIEQVVRYLKLDKKHTRENINIIMPSMESIEKVNLPNSDESWQFIQNKLGEWYESM